jgi:hypothetical protein
MVADRAATRMCVLGGLQPRAPALQRVPGLVALEKSYLSYMVSDKDTLYMKIVFLDQICKFLVLSFIISGR